MADGLDETTSQTIELLNYRLRRAHFLIYGSVGPGDSPEEVVQPVKDQAVSVRLRCIEAALAQLSSKSRPIQEYLWLYTNHHDLFQTQALDKGQSLFSETEQLSVVNSCATSYAITVSRLNSIQDLPIPSSALSASLISLHPRLFQLKSNRGSLAQEIADLRLRTAAVLQRWYEISVLGGGECWTGWEDRVTAVEKIVRRTEVTKIGDIGVI